MTIKYLIAGPAGALASFIAFLILGFGVLAAIGFSWLVGCVAIAALVVFEVFKEADAKSQARTAATVNG